MTSGRQAGLLSNTVGNSAAICLISKPGRHSGTYAHKDIAFEFASWVSVEFKLYLINIIREIRTRTQANVLRTFRHSL